MKVKASPSSLINKIKSQYILRNIFSYAYPELKSFLKLIKYNKNLLNEFNINIKNYYTLYAK